MTRSLSFLLFTALLAACSTENSPSMETDGGISPIVDGSFVCLTPDATACINNVYHFCAQDGEFLIGQTDDCTPRDMVCVPELGCVPCRPNSLFCVDNDAVECNDDGTGYALIDECNPEAGFVCDQGSCVNLCENALTERSYVGCEFYGVDLDNAAIALGKDASAQQYSIVVSNPSSLPTEVWVERNLAAPNAEPNLQELQRITVLPGDLEVLQLPRREVDGSSSFRTCSADETCDIGEGCWCAGELRVTDPEPTGGHRDCRCRVGASSTGLNDGTHSALSSHAYRVRSVLPIIAYQFNPLSNVGVFSNDASLLLPTSAIGRTYTVLGWPQTIADSSLPGYDFDPTRDDEDLRAFLTIVGSTAATHVTVTLGPQANGIIPVGGATLSNPNGGNGDVWEFDIGPFDVINLESDGFNVDFTGTEISADQPVAVFTGSEASDAPRFDSLANRQCCADHLEEQLFPNDTLGRTFYIGQMPSRSVALNNAFLTVDSVGAFDEPYYVRIVATETGTTTVTTTLSPPDNEFTLERGVSRLLTTTADFRINSDRAIAVLQTLPSQQAVGIPSQYPGGDPAIVAIAPVEQYRSEYVFLTPTLYAFDFIVITAPRGAEILFDESPLQDLNCEVAAADGIERLMGDPPPDWEVHRCQLSFPDVLGGSNVKVEAGIQNDGYHTIRATEDIGLVIYGFDAYVSYAYSGGLNLDPVR